MLPGPMPAPKPAFVVPIHDLDVMGRDVRAPITKAWLDAALEGCEIRAAGPDGALAAHVSKTGNDVLVRGEVRVVLEVSCARCLEPVPLDRTIELSLLLHPSPTAGRGRAEQAHRNARRRVEPERKGAGRARADEEYEFATEEADEDTYDGEEVVLDRFVREAIVLEEPIFPLCSEACEGIRPPSPTAEATSGSRAPDPRLAPIVELASKRKTKE